MTIIVSLFFRVGFGLHLKQALNFKEILRCWNGVSQPASARLA